MLFSDSQSAVGILTLGWENKSHTSVVFEIKQIMDILKRQNVEIDINWTPGHAEITGNEIADRLAKEAAVDAENMPEVCTPLTSIDIKRAVKDSCTVKWQNRWEASQAGRHMYAGFALPIAIVAKCEKIINLVQKNINLATTIGKRKIASIFFVWCQNRHLRLQVSASCRLMVINVYLNCQLTPQLSTTQFSS